MTKDDFLKECMNGFSPIPIDEFNRLYCRICSNRECARSGSNNFLFDRRTSSWEEKLFIQVPRARDNDPNFTSNRSKKFLPVIDSTSIIDVQRTQNFTPTRFEPVQISSEKEKQLESESIPEPSNTVNEIETRSEPAQEPTPLQVQKEIPMDNTPFIQGSMIGGGNEEEVIIIESGGTFTFGDK